MKHFFIISLFLFCFSPAFTQNRISEGQLAAQYSNGGEYLKASQLYLKLYKQTKAKFYFSSYIICLINLEDYSTAEKEIKKQLKENPKDLSLYVERGLLYKYMGKRNKMEQSFKSAINKISPNLNQVRNLANSFTSRAEYEWAEKAFLKARQIKKDNKLYRYELANLYYLQRKQEAMIEEYFQLLEESPNFQQSVRVRLQMALNNDVMNSFHDIILKELLSKTQEDPNNKCFAELMIWFRIQEKLFGEALTIAIALDKRLKEDGKRVFDIAQIAFSNNNFQTSIDGYQYLINKGKPNIPANTTRFTSDGKKIHTKKENVYFPFYKLSMIEIINARYAHILSDNYPEISKLKELEKEINSTITIIGRDKNTSILLRKLALIQGIYIDKTESAINILENIENISGVSPIFIDECKIDLANIHLSLGKIWEATLIYAAVEKRNSNSPIGHLAKYNKSKLAFYAGNFKWARAQLDALKASTTKLIANDAMALSLLISDNTGPDSTNNALIMYSRADLLFFQKKDSLALLTIDSLLSVFPRP